MSNQRRPYEDRLLETALQEKLSGKSPPDLTERVLAAAEDRVQPAAESRWGRVQMGALMAVSACLLLAMTGATWLFSQPRFHDEFANPRVVATNQPPLPLPYYLHDDLAHFAPPALAPQANEPLEFEPMWLESPDVAKNEPATTNYSFSEAAAAGDAPLDGLTDLQARSEVVPLYEQQRARVEALSQLSAANGARPKGFNAEAKDPSRPLTLAVTPRILVREEEESQLGIEFVEGKPAAANQGRGAGEGGDRYARVVENDFLRTSDNPLSTFSIDVDTASYSKTRMYLLLHRQLPPPDAVRIEELVNYFDYDYAGPQDDRPFAAHLEAAACPWNAEHRLVRIALRGRQIEKERPASNLVFLLDVSGSMDEPNKLPLVQQGMSMLVRQLGENDRVAMVVYAGAAGLVLPSTSGAERATILAAIERLHAGGSTNGGEGIRLAYQTALDHFIAGGVNRVILCTDGDFNVGVTSPGDITRLAEENAKAGVYLSVLGFGMGNHNDALLEEVSNKANGNYAFIDTENEARKVLVEQINGTLVTIAKDVKIQVEFNPQQVAAYRLLGYEDRLLAAEDFNNDQKDAGEIGAGHTVTALYEIVPAQKKDRNAGEGSASSEKSAAVAPPVDDLKYQKSRELTPDAQTGELLTLKLRYKQPDADASTLMSTSLAQSETRFSAASRDFQFAAAAAAFGMILRGSHYRGDATLDAVQEIATSAQGEDRFGYRAEFLELVQAAKSLGVK